MNYLKGWPSSVLWVMAFVLISSQALAYNPPQRGDADYPHDAPASYSSITQKYQAFIENEAWMRLLNELELEFFSMAPSSPAEIEALAGYRSTKNTFLNSLYDLPSPPILHEFLHEPDTSVPVSHNTDVDSFVMAVEKESALPGSLTGLYQTDSINNVKSVFSGSVRSNQAETDSTGFKTWLRIIERGEVDFENSFIVSAIENAEVLNSSFEPEIKAFNAQVSAPLSQQEKEVLFALFHVPEPEFSEARLNTLFMLSDSIYSILQQAMAPFRQQTLQAIRDARVRWQDYSETAFAHQFPWEMFFNEVVGLRGSLEYPPDRHFFLLHPILAVEFTNPNLDAAWKPLDEATVEQAMQVNIFGVSWLDPQSRYQRKFSISGIVSYRSDISKPGYGISLGFKRWIDVGLVHRSYDGRDDFSLVFAADLWGLIAKEQSGFVRDNAQWLERAENLLR